MTLSDLTWAIVLKNWQRNTFDVDARLRLQALNLWVGRAARRQWEWDCEGRA